MIVKGGRRSGRTTQLFLEILSGTVDVIVWCRDPQVLLRMFTNMFPDFIKSINMNMIILIDNRKIEFANTEYQNYNKVLGFKGEMKADE